MKKRIFAITLTVLLSLSLCVPVVAANITEWTTTVTKTVEDMPDSSGDEPENISSYEINIPATLSLDEGDYFEITASKMDIKDKVLEVWVDYDRTFDSDGYFYLINTSNPNQKIPCHIARNYPGSTDWPLIYHALNCLVATFTEHSGTTPHFCGAMRVIEAGPPTNDGSGSVAGIYTGNIYFKIKFRGDN